MRLAPTRPPRSISVITAGGSDSTRDGLGELRPGHAVRDGLEPLQRLSAENESDVPHATSSPQPVIAVAAIFASSRRIRDASAGAKPSEATSRRSDQPPAGHERPVREAGEHGVATALKLGDALSDVALVAAQDGRGRKAEIATGIVVL